MITNTSLRFLPVPRPKSEGPSISGLLSVLSHPPKTRHTPQLQSRATPLWRLVSSSPISSLVTSTLVRAESSSKRLPAVSVAVAGRERCFSTTRRTSSSSASKRETMTTSTQISQSEVISSLPERFTKAKDAGDLLFFPSTVHKHEEHGVQVSEFPVPFSSEAFSDRKTKSGLDVLTNSCVSLFRVCRITLCSSKSGYVLPCKINLSSQLRVSI